MTQVRSLIAVALLITVSVTPASAERGFGVMVGELKGNAGEHVVGATVKLTTKSGEPLETTTNKDGKWRIGGVGKGQWTMLITAPGYAARVINVIVERENPNGGEPVVTVMRKMTVAARATD